MAVVGAGPAGFYTLAALLRGPVDVRADLFERLPAPGGLLRYGVAPDQPRTRRVARAFAAMADNPRVRYYGGVQVGRDLSVGELRRAYDAAVLCCGAGQSRLPDVPGHDLPGCISGAALAAWCNGHPDHAGRRIDLSHPVAVVVGNGNVALDAARVLSRTPDEPLNSLPYSKLCPGSRTLAKLQERFR